MATRTKSRKKLVSLKKDIATQTTVDEAAAEICYLQKKIKLLQIENESLRKYERVNNGRPKRLIARPTTPTTRTTPTTPTTQNRVGKLLGKGCTCKGNCSHKQCGCVKSDKSCGESCKCNNSICQNQEKDKENTSVSSTDSSLNSIEQEVSKKTESNDSKLNGSFNPMKPLRQLLRSPLGNISNSVSTCLSDTSLPRLNVKLEEEFLPVPEDIDKPEVDWQEHQAQLVRCSLCSRTFFPHRIKKHEASCKKI